MQGIYSNKSKSPRVYLYKSIQDNEDKQDIKEQTLEKLILQIDQLKKGFESDKKQIHDSFTISMQNKNRQFLKRENELTQKNSLLEQLLIQEQNKTIQLTRMVQEKQRNLNTDREKEQLKIKVQQLEQNINENQKSIKQPKDNSYIMMTDLISALQKSIVQTSKAKRLNISWLDYDVLDCVIYKQSDKCRFINKLQRIIDHFFNCLQESIPQQLSPYRVVPQTLPQYNKKIIQKHEENIPLESTPKKLSHSIKKHTQETQTVKQFTQISRFTQSDIIQQKCQQQHQSSQTQIKQGDFSCQVVILPVEADSQQQYQQQKGKEQQLKKQDQLQQQQQQQYQEQKITQDFQGQQTPESIDFQCQCIPITQDFHFQYPSTQVLFNSTEIQTNITSQNNLTQTDPVQSIENKSVVITHIQTQTEIIENTLQQVSIHKQSKITERDEESDNESGSSYDCNQPEYNSQGIPPEIEELQQDIQHKNEQIHQLEIKILETVQHYESKNKKEFKFDVIVKSKSCSLESLLQDKWQIKLIDQEIDQKFTVGLISPNKELMRAYLKCGFNIDEGNIELKRNEFYVKYFDENFVDRYRVDFNCKYIKHPQNFMKDSQQIIDELNFQQFWIDFICDNSNLIIYFADQITQNDLLVLKYIEQKNKSILVYVYQDTKIAGYTNTTNYSTTIKQQIIKLSQNQTILQMAFNDVMKSDLDWEICENSFFGQLQNQLAQICEGNDDFFQMGMNDDYFELQVECDNFKITNLYEKPVIQRKQIGNLVVLSTNAAIQEVICSGKCCLIQFEQDCLVELFDQKVQLKQISQNGEIELEVI